MSSFLRILLSSGAAALLSFMASPAQANVLLTFSVDNVTFQTCTGLLQPTCTTVAAAGFQESVLIGAIPLAAPTDSSAGGVLQSAAYFGFPLSMSGSPYTGALRARVSGPLTLAQSFTQLDNSFDKAGPGGAAAALIHSDIASDTTDSLGVRTQQEYLLGYSLSAQFSDLLSYTDLVNQSIDAFFSKYIGTMTGSFSELGSSSALDPLGLNFLDYAFSQYMGDVTLTGAEYVGIMAIPEPGSLALVLVAALGMLCARRRSLFRSSARLAR